MSKKTNNSKNSIIIICLIVALVACIVIGVMNKKKEENTNINTNGLDSFIDSKIKDTDFIQLVSSKFSRNEKIEYCIKKVMILDNTSSVSAEKVINYYIEIFGDDKDNPIIDYIRVENFNNYELNEETNEYTLKENNNIRERENNDNVKVELDSKKVEENHVIAKFKIIAPRPIMEFCSYFMNKFGEKEYDEKSRTIINKLNDIRVSYDNTKELTKEDVDYLLELAEEDIDKLAYVSEFEVVFEKLEDRFIIKDVKLL